MSYHRRCAGQSRQETRFAPPIAQDVTVLLMDGVTTVAGPAFYHGRGIFASTMRARLNMAYNRGNLDDSFNVGGVQVTFSSIREVK